MIDFVFNFENPSFTNGTYFVKQFIPSKPFQVFGAGDVLIGEIQKTSDGWEQSSGREMPQELVDGIGLQIDSL